ncbi:MAG TPA: ATP-binding protein [Methylomirabilota bacterium]|nr:ATP-binding protein [Methylomirabilota bacterium]
MGLRLRLILVLMIPPILVFGVYGVLRVRNEHADLLLTDRQSVVLISKAVQIAVERALRDPQTPDIEQLLAEIVDDQQMIDGLRIFDLDLRATVVSKSRVGTDLVATDLLRHVIATGHADGVARGDGAERAFYYLMPLRAANGTIVGAIEIAHLLAAVDARLRSATWDIVLRLSLLVASITLLTGVVLQRQVLRPLFALTEGIRNLGRGDPAQPLPVERADELGRVAEAFNTMADQLHHARRELVLETERAVDLEQQLRHSATLAVAGRLASGLAHEVGTPLNIISGRAELLLQSIAPDDPRRDELQVIVGQIDRISAMLRSLLDTVRPVKPDIQPVVLRRVVDPLLVLLAHTARRHGVALEVSIPDDLPPVRADYNQLQQVLINVLMNAFEAARPAGRVVVSAAREARAGEHGVRIAVRDSGPGIPASFHARIFEPFFSTKPPGEGTGLGLPISRDILKGLGGDIRVDSAPGTGTTFILWLPEHA